MATARLSGFLASVAVLLLSGCASYRTNSDVSFKTTNVGTPAQDVIITADSMSDRKYTDLGQVVATVKKLTVFHKNPTEEQANIVLAEKARALGADAVINVDYVRGIISSSWGAIRATGTAVKFTKVSESLLR